MSLITYAPGFQNVFGCKPINGKYIGMAIVVIPIMVRAPAPASLPPLAALHCVVTFDVYVTCDLYLTCDVFFFVQIVTEELRKFVVRAFPAAIKQVDAKGGITMQPNPHVLSFIAKMTQY